MTQSQELRRGSESAEVNSLAFDISGRWFGCSSDSGTVHIFVLKQLVQEFKQKKKIFIIYNCLL